MKFLIKDQAGKQLYEGFLTPGSDGIKIGSSETCDVILKLLGISEEHVRLQAGADGQVFIQDLQTPFGTHVNGRKVQPGFITPLQPGTIVQLSENVFLHLEPSDGENLDLPPSSLDNSMTTIFPFFLNKNERFVRNLFSALRSNMPAKFHEAVHAAEKEITDKVRELSAILEVSYALNTLSSFQKLLEYTLEMAMKVTGSDRGFIMLHNEELDRLETVINRRIGSREIEKDMLTTSGIVLRCFRSGKPIIEEPSRADSGTHAGKSTERVIRSIIVTPLRIQNTTIGVLYLDTKDPTKLFDERTQDLLKVFAAQASVAIHNAKLFHLATTDGLTGVSNNKHFHQRLLEEFYRSIRHKKSLSLIMIDIDRFKHVNEVHGSNSGDQLLKRLGRILKLATRVHDLIARFGGDEFALLLPETSLEGALTVAEKLRHLVDTTSFRAGRKAVKVTTSIGIATVNPYMTKPMDLVQAGDNALTEAKNKGGNRVNWEKEKIK